MNFDDEKTRLLDRPAEVRPHARSACFVVIAGSQAGRMYKLERNELVIGRAADASVRIEDDGVSRYHARVSTEAEGRVVIEDMGSTNGTFCNGERVTRHTMQDGDKIQLGRASVLKFSFQDPIEEDFQRRQHESSVRDTLTGCYNRAYLLERLSAEFAFSQRHTKMLSVAVFDIDSLKFINATHGQAAGDYVLREVGLLMQQEHRRGDVLARYGGEEFVIIMREIGVGDAFAVAERVRRRVETTRLAFSGTRIPVTLSIGIAQLSDRSAGSVDELMQQANRYLQKAKAKGRNRTECELFG